jgi:hypothetical protein
MLEAMAQGRLVEKAGHIHAAMQRAVASADYREATVSFMEKRSPRFIGR